MDLQSFFIEMGLSKKEATVYLASLEIGESTLMPIASRAHIPAMSTKYVLQKLHYKGCVTAVKNNGRFLYRPNPPAQLLKNLQEKRRLLERDILRLEDALPALSQHISRATPTPRVQFYSANQIADIYEKILATPSDDIYWLVDLQTAEQSVGAPYLRQWVTRRALKRMTFHILRTPIKPRGATARDVLQETTLRAIRFVPESYACTCQILLCGECVAFIPTQNEAFGVLIISRETVATVKDLFNNLWKESKEAKVSPARGKKY